MSEQARRPSRGPRSAPPDPYRAPGEPAGPEDRPRGVVVRQAATPEELEALDRRRQQARFRAEAVRATAELEEAQRRAARIVRLQGAAAVLVGLGLAAFAARQLEAGYAPRAAGQLVPPAAVTLGLWLLAVGAGGASSLAGAPAWVKRGAVAAMVLGAIWGATGYLELLRALAS